MNHPNKKGQKIQSRRKKNGKGRGGERENKKGLSKFNFFQNTIEKSLKEYLDVT